MWGSDVVCYEAPEREVIQYFLLTEIDSLARETEPDESGGEDGYSSYLIEIVDRDAPFLDVEIAGSFFIEFQNTAADGTVEETDAYSGCETITAWFYGVERFSALEDVLCRFIHTVLGYFDAEATGS